MTTGRERFVAAGHGQSTDRPPVGAWIHYGTSFYNPRQAADVHLWFGEEYDWDYLKVMDDFRLEHPAGLDEITDVAQFADVVPDPGAPLANLERQAETLRLIREGAPQRAIIDTVFSPMQTLVRAFGADVVEYFKADAALAHEVISRVATALASYASRLGDLGVDGIFLAVNGASSDSSSMGITAEQFDDWVAPYDRQVLEAAAGLVRIIHLHGEGVDLERVRDYPAEVASWSDLTAGISVAEVRDELGLVPMFGLDEVNSMYWTPSRTRQEVRRARELTGDRLILAPNCTVHSDLSPAVLRAFRELAEEPLQG